MFKSVFIPIHLHSLFFITIALIIGIWSATFLTMWAVGISAGITLLAGLCNKKLRYPIILCVLSAIIGNAHYHYHLNKIQHTLELLCQKPTAITGTITDIKYLTNPKRVQVVTVHTSNITLPLQEQVSLDAYIELYVQQPADVAVADRICIDNPKIKKSNNAQYQWYLFKEKISASIFCTNLAYTLIERPLYSWARHIAQIKENLLAACKTKLHPAAYALFSSIFLGNKTVLKKQLKKTNPYFQAWGISHYLARSGLHLVIFVFVWYLLLNLLPLSFNAKQLILLVLCGAYYLFSWSSVSFMRAFLTFLIYKFSILMRLQVQLLHVLCLVTISILLINPLQLFFLDFQLSFGITFGLAWFIQVSNQKLFIKSTNY